MGLGVVGGVDGGIERKRVLIAGRRSSGIFGNGSLPMYQSYLQLVTLGKDDCIIGVSVHFRWSVQFCS